jgi:5-methylcytosine-specific restriction protein A
VARKEFPRKVKAAVIARANGKCEACGAALKPGESEVDHILPDALGGKPDASNAMLMCKVCHNAKTVWDVRRVRKADRQRDKGTGAIKPKGGMPHVPFPSRQKADRPAGKTPVPRQGGIRFWPITGHSESGD